MRHLDPEARAKMGLAGHERVQREHDVTVNTAALYDIYLDRVGRN